MLRNAARPKLSLAVPALSVSISSTAAATPRSAAPPTPLSPRSPRSPLMSATTPLTQAARNAQLNLRGASTLQIPTFAYSNGASGKGILKRGVHSAASASAAAKSLRFDEVPSVLCVSPLPMECHGGYVKMSKDERRWKKD